MNQQLLKLAALLMALAPAGALSAPILDIQGGQLVGAMGVDVDGTLYDVSFVDGTCGAVFGGCDDVSDFTFMTLTDAQTAAQALLDMVFVDVAAGMFDTAPALTFGCEITGFCLATTPFGFNATGSITVASAFNDDLEAGDMVFLGALNPAIDLSADEQAVWARWTPTLVTGVPEPGTLALLGLGLAGIGFAQRKRHA